MSTQPPSGTAPLPISQLESLKFKAAQIIESLTSLYLMIQADNRLVMAAWPDILSKYNVLLSQTHNFSTALVNPFPTSSSSSSSKPPTQNMYEGIALYPKTGMTDSQLDNEVIPLLRNQQTTDVLKSENDTVRRLAEHMNTRGSLGVLGMVAPPAPAGVFAVPRKPEYEDVLRECAEIREAHDARVDRAVRAVTMLREKFDWKQRVVVEVEEPEELDWDPRLGREGAPMAGESLEDDVGMGSDEEEDDDDDEMEADGQEGHNTDEDDEFNVEGALFNADGTSPPTAPGELNLSGSALT